VQIDGKIATFSAKPTPPASFKAALGHYEGSTATPRILDDGLGALGPTE
jgi:hypothetical protein